MIFGSNNFTLKNSYISNDDNWFKFKKIRKVTFSDHEHRE